MGFSLVAILFFAAVSARNTPFGVFPSECVHTVPNGAHITEEKGITTVFHDSLPNGKRVIPHCAAMPKRKQPGVAKKQFPVRNSSSLEREVVFFTSLSL